MNRAPVQESERTIKAREKLKKHLESIDGQVSPEALSEKKEEIERWITRHASNRVVLPKKAITLFDENRNAASMSRKTSQIADEIKKRT